MFRNDLKQKLGQIFGFAKTTLNAPGESIEQDTLFIEITSVQSKAGSGYARAKVMGQVVTFSQNGKLPYGFFSKRLAQAGKKDPTLVKDFFFYDMDIEDVTSPAREQDLCERRSSFIFLYTEQYNPKLGEMTQIEFDREFIDVGDGNLIDSGEGEVIEK